MPLRNAPKPAGKEGNIHALRAHDAKASLLPGFADVGPAHHMVLLLVALTSPEEPRLVFGHLLMEGLMKAIEAHEKPEKAGKRGVD